MVINPENFLHFKYILSKYLMLLYYILEKRVMRYFNMNDLEAKGMLLFLFFRCVDMLDGLSTIVTGSQVQVPEMRDGPLVGTLHYIALSVDHQPYTQKSEIHSY